MSSPQQWPALHQCHECWCKIHVKNIWNYTPLTVLSPPIQFAFWNSPQKWIESSTWLKPRHNQSFRRYVRLPERTYRFISVMCHDVQTAYIRYYFVWIHTASPRRVPVSSHPYRRNLHSALCTILGSCLRATSHSESYATHWNYHGMSLMSHTPYLVACLPWTTSWGVLEQWNPFKHVDGNVITREVPWKKWLLITRDPHTT